MRKSALQNAINEAKSFIKQGEKAQKDSHHSGACDISKGRESGALRRKSMDLTNALVDLRKP